MSEGPRREAYSQKCLELDVKRGLHCRRELGHDGQHEAWHPAGFLAYWQQALEMPWVTRK